VACQRRSGLSHIQVRRRTRGFVRAAFRTSMCARCAGAARIGAPRACWRHLHVRNRADRRRSGEEPHLQV